MALVDIAEPQIFTFDGALTEFDFPHRVRDVLDVGVVYVDADGARSELDYGADYILVGVTKEGATVRFLDDPRPAGAYAVATRETPREQPKNFYDTKRPTPRLTQDALNNLAMVIQDAGARADLGFRLPAEEYESPIELGRSSDRAGRVQAFDETGRPSYPLAVADLSDVVANKQKFLDLHAIIAAIVALAERTEEIDDLALIKEEIEAIGDQCALAAIQCVAGDLEAISFVAEHIPAAYDVFRLAFSKQLFGGLIQAGGLYQDEGPIDTLNLGARDEGAWPDPVALILVDKGFVIDLDVADPPLSPTVGQAWVIAPTATGAWAGRENQIATWTELSDGVYDWSFYAPAACDIIFAADESAARYIFTEAGEWRLTDPVAPLLYHPNVNAVIASDEGLIV